MPNTVADDSFDEIKASNILLGVGMLGIGLALVMQFLEKGTLRATEAQKIMSAPRRVLVIGDSLAVGMAGTFEKLAKSGPHSVVAKGCPIGSKAGQNCTAIVGSSSLQWANDSWLGDLLKSFKPTVVLISLGTNDFLYGEAAKPKVKQSVNEIVRKIRSAGAVPVWIEPVSMPFDDTAGVKDSWKSAGIPYFSSRWLSYKRTADGIHLTQDGYRDWATRIWGWLLEQ